MLRDRNLDEAMFQQGAELVARLGVRVYPSEDLRTMRVKCGLSVDDGLNDPNAVNATTNPLDPMPANMEREPANGCEKVPPAPPIITSPHPTVEAFFEVSLPPPTSAGGR